ncbi:MAG: hypothetical protein JZU53_03735 [Paludibacter sp.]|nr:hypothetical protein [Paludibacter sp.]
MDIQNVFALNLKDETIHISEAESGRKGYFCLGCKRELQAVKQTKENRMSYFRHDHNGLQGEGLCTYSDETYRHQLAKQILLNYKKVKVPAIYKYPPKDSSGLIANLISKEKYIEASFGVPELSFYEDNNGVIHYENVFPDSNENNLLIRPDITFFNNQSKPILLIELVATHKLTEEKKLRIKRLGIDCIQITIPKDSPEKIEKIFDSTEKTKWIYNYEQESREYIPTTIPVGEGISFVDEDQRKFFEESYKCRISQIGNLIRTIKRCLVSEQYTESVSSLESEISRVEGNSATERDDLERLRADHELRIEALRAGIRAKVERKHKEEFDRISNESTRLNTEEKEFTKSIEEYRSRIEDELSKQYPITVEEEQSRYSNLEERYYRKKSELIRDTENEERIIRETNVSIYRLESTIAENLRDISKEEREIEDIERQINKESGIEKDFRNQIQYTEDQIRRLEDNNVQQRNELSKRIRTDREELEKRYKYLRRQFIDRVEGRGTEENEYTRKYQKLLDDLVKTSDYIIAKRNYERYEKAWRCFTSEAYKNWHD